jgi:septum site-determining protein MinC
MDSAHNDWKEKGGLASAVIKKRPEMASSLLQGAIFTMMVVKIEDPADPDFASELGRQIALSPRFFDNAPVVLDIKGSLAFLDPGEFEDAKALLRRHKLIPIGVQNASGAQLRAAFAAGLCSFNASSPSRRVAEPTPAARPEPARPVEPPPSAPAAAELGGTKSRMVTQPVRSGAQIYARGADLVVTNSVSAGAEIIADGNIHVYGTLRGRAIAGANGDAEARIFCNRLEAELISVAGRYLVSENIAPELRGQAVQVSLDGDRLAIVRT